MAKGKMVKKEENYLNEIFLIIQKMEKLAVADKKTKFNNIEIRMIGEILSAEYVGKRLISTQLAKNLGVTRSAISQIVNKLEAQGIVRRVPDAVDRKIAYIELTEETNNSYKKDMKIYLNFIGRVVDEFGEENFQTMCSLFNDFYTLVEEKKKEIH